MGLHRARGSADLREVASGFAAQSLWLRNRKVRSQVSGIDRSRFPGRRTVRKLRRGGRQGRREDIRVSILVLLIDFLGLCKSVWQIPSTFPFAIAGRPNPFALHRQRSASNFFFQLQICFAVGDFLENFLTNARCTVLFEFVRAYSNTQNAFSLLLNTI